MSPTANPRKRKGWFEGLLRKVPIGFYRNLSWQFVASMTSVAVGFVYSILVARTIGVGDFGLMSLGLSFATVTFQVVELRLQEAVIRYVAEFWEARDDRRTVAALKLFLFADLGTGLVAFSLVLVGARWAEAHLLHDARGPSVMFLAATTVFFSNVATATAYGVYRVFGEFRLQAIIMIATSVAKLVATTVAMFALGCGVVGVLVVAAAASLIANGLLIGFAVRVLLQRISRGDLRAPLSLLAERKVEMRKFVTNTYLLSLTMIPTKDLDTNILGIFAPLHVVGVYKIAKSFMSAVWTVSDPIFLVVYPELARLWTRRAFGELRAFIKRIVVVGGVSALAAYLVAFATVPAIIVKLLGAGYAPAGSLFRWMTWGVVIWGPLVWVNPLLMAAGRPDLVLKSSLGTALATLALFWLVIPHAGALGAGIVSALATPIVLSFAIILGRRNGIILPPPDGATGQLGAVRPR